MKHALGFLTAIVATTSTLTAHAADVYVRQTRGSDLTRAQIHEVTDLVREAVRDMPEHRLVDRQSDADFVLQPAVLTRSDEMVLRIEKLQDDEILAMSEETIRSLDATRTRTVIIAETALQDEDGASLDDGTVSATTQSASTQSVSSLTASENDNSVGTLTAGSPRLLNPDRAGQFQIGVGPAFGVGLEASNAMYNIHTGYALDFNDQSVGKIFGDFNLGTGSESARFINLGVAGEFYPNVETIAMARPYIGADVGFAFVRNSDEQTADNVAVGAGTGLKFQASEMNWDVNAHYTVLLDQIADRTPSVFGVRVAIGL